MFGRKKKHINERGFELDNADGDNIQILVTREDKTGNDIMRMSDFFESAVHQLSRELMNENEDSIIVNELPIADFELVNDALQVMGAFCSPEFDLVPDFSSLPKDILKKFKAGELVLGDSKQVDGNVRAVLVDVETNSRVKDVTLKKLARTDQTASITRDMVTQMQLRQISEKIDYLESEQAYLIEFARNQAIIRPFLDARDYILSAQNAKNKVEQKEYLDKASEKMITAINAVYVDITTIESELAKDGKRSWYKRFIRSNLDKQIERITRDMQVVTRYVGIQLQVLHHLGRIEEKKNVMEKFNRRVSRFFENGVVAADQSLALFIHGNIEYTDKNMDSWYNFEKQMEPLIESAYDNLDTKDVYVLTTEEE